MAKNIPTVYSDARFQSGMSSRLRESAKACRALDRSPLLHEAADWIDELEKALKALAPKPRQKGRRNDRNKS